jgi:hypothetical protein
MTEKEKLDAAVLENRKVKALERIANSMETLTMWVDEIDKAEWSERIQFYLFEFLENSKPVKKK